MQDPQHQHQNQEGQHHQRRLLLPAEHVRGSLLQCTPQQQQQADSPATSHERKGAPPRRWTEEATRPAMRSRKS